MKQRRQRAGDIPPGKNVDIEEVVTRQPVTEGTVTEGTVTEGTVPQTPPGTPDLRGTMNTTIEGIADVARNLFGNDQGTQAQGTQQQGGKKHRRKTHKRSGGRRKQQSRRRRRRSQHQ